MAQKKGAAPPWWSVSELDRIGSRCADCGIMGSSVVNVGVCHVVGDRLQDLQDLGAVAGAVQESSCEVSSHERRKVKGQGVLRSAGELSEGGRCHVGRGTTGAVEVYHALCLLQSGEPLRAPLAIVVGGLVTDFDSHGVDCGVRVL